MSWCCKTIAVLFYLCAEICFLGAGMCFLCAGMYFVCVGIHFYELICVNNFLNVYVVDG